MRGAARDLLSEIEALLRETGVSPTKFGLAAVNDGHLVANLRKGASITLKTADRVRAYLAQARTQQRHTQADLVSRETVPPGRRIVLIIGGGIAAYKCLELIRRLRERDIGVRAVLTKAAHQFVTPLSVSALSNERVFTDLFDLDEEREIGHIRLSREADLIVVAPATADLLAKMAGGHADDLASAVLMATDKPVLAAPAMNPRMWLHPATRRNVAQLEADGIGFVGPGTGEMAERGEAGPGRLAEVPELLEAIEAMLGAPPSPLVREGQGGGDTLSVVVAPPLPARGRGTPHRPPRRPPRPRHQRADARAYRPRALHRQPLLRQAGRGNRRRGGSAGRRRGPRQRSNRPVRPTGRRSRTRRDGARDAGGRARGAARRHRHLRRRRC
jgi:hypothetical protein